MRAADYNVNVMPKFKFIGETRTIVVNDRREATLEMFEYMYDECEKLCCCTRYPLRVDFTDLPSLDDGLFVESYTSCPINALSALFMR